METEERKLKAKAFLMRHNKELAEMILSGKDSLILKKGKYPEECEEELQEILILLPDVEQVFIEEEGIKIIIK